MNKKVFWLLKKSVRFCFPYIIVNILILIAINSLSIFLNILNKNITNELFANTFIGSISNYFVVLVVLYMVLYFIESSSSFLIVLGQNFYRLNVDQLFHSIFMYKSYKASQTKFFETEFMEKYSFISGRTNMISSYIGNLCNLLFSGFFNVISTIILFAIYEPWLILFTITYTIIAAIVTKIVTEKQYKLDKEQIKDQRFSDYYKDILTNKKYAKELRIYKLKSYIYDKWIYFYEKTRFERLNLVLKGTKLFNKVVFCRLICRMLAICVLLLGLYYNKYNIGVFVMLFGLIDTNMSKINEIISLIISGVLQDTKYLCDYYDFIYPITNKEIKNIKNNSALVSAPRFDNFNEIKLKNVDFTYPSADKKALKNIDFYLKKGEVVSVLGYNGSGKTTLSKILNGSFFPQNGNLYLNNTLINDNNRNSLFEYFGNATQEFSHFSLPIKEFVGLGYIEKMNDKSELDSAYNMVGIENLLSKFPYADSTILGKEYDEEGQELSGGEWQRLLLASAYMGNHEILLLDEPTASIDPLLEMDFINKIKENLQGKTAVLISHHIGFARIADRIILMDDGKIVEQGTHDYLLSINGVYSKLFNEQKKLYENEDKLI